MVFGIRPRSFGVLRGCPGLALPVLPLAEAVGTALLYASAELGKNANQVGEVIGQVLEVEDANQVGVVIGQVLEVEDGAVRGRGA